MNYRLSLASLLLGLSCTATSWAVTAPRDVAAFIEQFTTCDYFRGEEAFDVQRSKFLKSQIQASCPGLSEKLRALKRKYRRDKVVSAQLSSYSDDTDSR